MDKFFIDENLDDYQKELKNYNYPKCISDPDKYVLYAYQGNLW